MPGTFASTPGPRYAPLARFRSTVPTGQPGAGKTRMATELARARARRGALEDPPRALADMLQRDACQMEEFTECSLGIAS